MYNVHIGSRRERVNIMKDTIILAISLNCIRCAVIDTIGAVTQDVISRRLFWDFRRKCPHELSLSCHLNNDVLVVCVSDLSVCAGIIVYCCVIVAFRPKKSVPFNTGSQA